MIAVELFGRNPGYDPKLDRIVRTEAMRLRARLDKYYAAEGTRDPLIIELPKGGKSLAERQAGVAEILQAPELAWMRPSARFAMLRKQVNLAP